MMMMMMVMMIFMKDMSCLNKLTRRPALSYLSVGVWTNPHRKIKILFFRPFAFFLQEKVSLF